MLRPRRPPPPLPDELVEEVLLRFPPENPAGLVRAGLVCRRWRRLVSDAGFCCRFREFHRSPPMLGMLCTRADTHLSRFVPTTAFCSPRTDRGHWRRALDARHGRVLFHGSGNFFVVWDPITDEEWMLPFPPQDMDVWTAAVICAAAGDGAGACDHLHCHRGPFTVIFLGTFMPDFSEGVTFICTYSSEAAVWSEPIVDQQPEYADYKPSALVGNALYFDGFGGRTALRYNLESRQMSSILLPFSLHLSQQYALITTKEGGLGLTLERESILYIWLMKDTHKVGGDAHNLGGEWKPSKLINLRKLLPVDAALAKLDVVGSAEGLSIMFIRAGDVVYTIDLNTEKVKKVYEGKIKDILPYMNFYAPGTAMEAACTGSEEPSVGGSSA